jgi:hypothetical protein
MRADAVRFPRPSGNPRISGIFISGFDLFGGYHEAAQFDIAPIYKLIKQLTRIFLSTITKSVRVSCIKLPRPWTKCPAPGSLIHFLRKESIRSVLAHIEHHKISFLVRRQQKS